MNIIFMGTPDFALAPLRAIHSAGYNIVAIYTQAPKRSGRGLILSKSPVHEWGESNGIEVYTPKSLRKSEEEQERFCNINADMVIVVAYGLILPAKILNHPKYGCVNIHASLLPRWRGASPIHHSIMHGDSKTGISIMKMDEGVDTGDVYKQESIDILKDDTTTSLADRLSILGSKMIVEAIPMISGGVLQAKKQEGNASYSRMLSKEDGNLDFNEDALVLERRIRALKCYITTKKDRINVLKAKVIEDNSQVASGTILDDKFIIKCGKNALQPLVLQRAGKKAVSVDEFLNGYRLVKGSNIID